ncbi:MULTISPECIES: hypothetical protein [Enterococcus]|uniref:hypothetical protein n=1 Tax=Enterococcus TaxID=1350 RepID=UPI001C610108|nr:MULTISPECIES: hypothetical protein [Enterococcus]MDV7688780.1 hypothetical protein [Enterococcus casseliflavus]MDV7787609.1 hypothetical protein [Enterococcus gallinarum]UJA23816.1 hypothetical protein HED61_09740 [Enterococcus gallinarum]
MNDIREIERMTIWEYELRMTAYALRRLDVERDIHWKAWVNRQVKAEKNIGTAKKPKMVHVFNDFKEFFDYEGNEKRILGIEEDETPIIQDNKLKGLMMKANS